MNTYSEGMDSERTGSGSIAAFVCGAALGATVGAAIALIMAPATGRDTRAYLKRRGNELGRDAMERGRETLAEPVGTREVGSRQRPGSRGQRGELCT